jgi:hypothetical protein
MQPYAAEREIARVFLARMATLKAIHRNEVRQFYPHRNGWRLAVCAIAKSRERFVLPAETPWGTTGTVFRCRRAILGGPARPFEGLGGASRSSSPAIPTSGGEGKAAEVDGGNFGGYVKPANVKHIAVIAV